MILNVILPRMLRLQIKMLGTLLHARSEICPEKYPLPPQPKRADAQWPQCIIFRLLSCKRENMQWARKTRSQHFAGVRVAENYMQSTWSSWEWTRTRDNHEWADRSSHYYTVSHRASPRHSFCTISLSPHSLQSHTTAAFCGDRQQKRGHPPTVVNSGVIRSILRLTHCLKIAMR